MQHLTRNTTTEITGQHHQARVLARAARGPLEQLHAQVVLQILDRSGQRRLLDVQAFGRASEVEFFGNSNKVAQAAEFHPWAIRCQQRASGSALSIPGS